MWEEAAVTDKSECRMLLDTAALDFRAFYAVPDTVRTPNGIPINADRGLLDIIARLASEFQPMEIVACWDDDWRPQWRVNLIPTYKTHRVAELLSSDEGQVRRHPCAVCPDAAASYTLVVAPRRSSRPPATRQTSGQRALTFGHRSP
jgi:5'-3' exonuclease